MRGRRRSDREARPFGFRILGPLDEPPDRLRWRMQLLVTTAMVVANLGGAAAVAALAVWVIPRPNLLDTPQRTLALVLAPTYVAAAVLVGGWWGTRRALGALQWVPEERAPTPDEQRAALLLPARLVVVPMVLWSGAIVLFGLLALGGGVRVGIRTAATVLLGAIVTWAFAYLLSELALRPVAARALATAPPQVRTPGLGSRTLLVWLAGTGAPAAGLVIVAVVSLVDRDVTATVVARTTLVISLITIVAGLGLQLLGTKAVTDPLRALAAALHRVEQGDLSTRVVVYDGSEIGRLQAAFNQMVEQLEERERLRDLFRRHVGDEVARAALERGTELGGERRDATAVFVDVIGSTTLAESVPPEVVVEVLNEFFHEVVTAVESHGGWVNKFEGDAALCVFGPPAGLPGHATAALRAVRDLAARLERLGRTHDLAAGIGVATGTVTAGNVGAEQRYEYTVIGDAVNVAARLTEEAKEHRPRVLTAASTIEAADPEERRHWHEVGTVALRGRVGPIRTWTFELDAGPER